MTFRSGIPGSKLFVLVLAAVLSVSCASIPEHSDPTPVKPMLEGDSSIEVRPPQPGLDSFGLVRNFVETSAAPENNHRAARLHLVPERQSSWRVPSEMLILDNIDTVPGPRRPDTPRDVQVVRLQADRVGWLHADHSFTPEAGGYQRDLRLRRDSEGQWRLTDPPPELVASRASFEKKFTPVRAYFLDHDWRGVVPDRRYVVSDPASNLPRRVIDLLISGPSRGFRNAMHTAVPTGVQPKTNPSEAADGALVVNLSDLGEISPEARRLIAAQVVLSLKDVSNARVRLLEEGSPLLASGRDLRPSDVRSYEQDNRVDPNSPGLAIVDEKIHTLDQAAEPIPGPAGSGQRNIVRAGQSADGSRIATVMRNPNGVGLRVGPYGEELTEIGVEGADMTAPSWRGNSELWTVVNDHELVRVREAGGGWTTTRIDTQQFSKGRPIDALRLSHDGTRVAGLVDGRVVVAGVWDDNGTIRLENPVALTGNLWDSDLTSVEWLNNDTLVATTGSNAAPVVELSVDGFKWKTYPSANLSQPLTALAVSPTGKVVVVDGNGLWQSSSHDDLWSFVRLPIKAGSLPFYPG